MREAALAWAARGFKVFPIRAGAKFPPLVPFTREATTDVETIEAWWRRWPGANYGVLTTGLVVVDIDNKNGKPGDASYVALLVDHGLDIDDTLTVQSPNGGRHKYLLGDECRCAIDLLPGVDIKAHNGYVLGPGSRIDTGTYEVVADVMMADAPQSLIDAVGAPRTRPERAPMIELDTPFSIRRATEWLANDAPLSVKGEGGDKTAYRVACGVRDFGVSEALCFDLMLPWNDRSPPGWSDERLREKIEHAYTYATSAQGVSTPEVMFAGVEIPEPEYRPRQRGKAIWAGDDIDFDQEWLLFERLPQVGTAMVVAPSGAGKTFLAYELARCLATGDKFFGTEPDDKCGAVILAGEGLAGVPARMKTLGKLPIVTLPVGQLGDKANVKTLVQDLEDIAVAMREKHSTRLGLIVVDTLTAVGLLQDENNNSECGAAVKALEALALRFNCMVLVNHHPPKNGTGARGGGALHAGFDVVLEVAHEKGQEIRYVECTKAREGRVGAWGSFTLISVTVGFDRRGRARTTCEVSMGSEPRIITGKVPPKFDAFESAIETARVNDDVPKGQPVKRASVQTAFGELAHISDRGNRSKAFNKCLDFAAAAGRVRVIRGANDEQFINDQVKEE